jgi:hypothetical protein
MQALPEGVTTAAELRAHYRRTARKLKTVTIVDRTPAPIPVPVFYQKPTVTYARRNTYYLTREEARIAIRQAAAKAYAEQQARDAAEELQRVARIADIVAAVGAYYGVSKIDLLSDCRTPRLILPRHVAMYLARTLTPCSLPMIGRLLNKDHTTVHFGYRKIARLIGLPDPDDSRPLPEPDSCLKGEINALRVGLGEEPL